MIEVVENDIKYKLGRNAQENFEIIDEAKKINTNYWWFHIENSPSGHCIVYTEQLDKAIIQYAGNLVKQYSKLKNQKNVSIIYTQLKFVKKNKTIGEVTLVKKTMKTSI